MSRQDDIKNLIVNHSRRLQKLKEQQALQGISIDPGVIIEIEDIEAAIKELETELKALEDSGVDKESPGTQSVLTEGSHPNQRVQIIQKGDFSSLSADRWSAAIDAFAAVIGISPQEIQVYRVYEGSIVFDLGMPPYAVQRLRSLLQFNSAQLRLLKVEKVIFEKESGQVEEWVIKERKFDVEIEQNLENYLTEICKLAASLLHVQNASIWLIDGHGKLSIKAGIGYFEKLLQQNASYNLAAGITGWVAYSGIVFRGTMEDVRNHIFYKGDFLDLSFKDEIKEPATLLTMPIYTKNLEEIIGIIKVEGTRKDEQNVFSEQDEIALEKFIRPRIIDIETKRPPGYQAVHPSSPPKPAVEHNLQERKVIPTFEGRQNEVKDCSTKLLKGSRRLVTISGDAGVGKTTLAIKIAWNLINQAKFGAIYFVELSTAKDVNGLFSKLARALKINYKLKGSENEFSDQKKAQLRKKLEERKTLLILDNFEGLIGDELCIELLKALLSIDSLRILVTSRPILGLSQWEKEYKLLPLESNEAANLFTRLSRRKVCTEEDKLLVGKICELVDYTPLAIELVSQHTEMGFKQLYHSLQENRLYLQSEMELALQNSYNPLEEQEKRLFLESSIFNGSFNLMAVNAITGQKDSYPSLQKLCEWKLLIRQSGVRYYFLESIKQFSKSKLDEEGEKMGIDKDDLSKKHANYYLESLEKHHENLDKIKTEYENIMGSLERITEQAKEETWARKLLIRSCFYLQEYWRIRGEWKVAREYTAKAVKAAQIENDLLSEAKLLFIFCQAGVDLGIFEKTHATFIEALTLVDRLLKENPDDSEVLGLKASLLHQYGRLIDNCIYKLGKGPALEEYADVPPPEKYFEESLGIWQKLQDERQKARILQARGFRAMVNDDLRKATSLQKESIKITREINYRELEGRCLHQMGRIARKLHDLVNKKYYISPEEIVEIRERLDKETQPGGSKSDFQRADILFNAACEIAIEIGDQRAESRTRREIGTLKITMAKEAKEADDETRESLLDEAEEELHKALEIAKRIGELTGEEKIQEELNYLEQTRRVKNAN